MVVVEVVVEGSGIDGSSVVGMAMLLLLKVIDRWQPRKAILLGIMASLMRVIGGCEGVSQVRGSDRASESYAGCWLQYP